MAIVTLFAASHCHGDEVARKVAESLGYRLLSQEELLAEASRRFRVSAESLTRALCGQRSVFDRITHEKQRSIAYLRATLADLVKDDSLVHEGYAGHLLPRGLTHVLRVAMVARNDYRVELAVESQGLEPRAAEKAVSQDDQERRQWIQHLYGLSPWDKSLYDVFLPMDSTSVEEAVALITENVARPALATTPLVSMAAEDFVLEARVHLVLADKGHEAEVASQGGRVTLTINKHVMRLEHHMEELKKLAREVPEVSDVEAKLGPHYRQPNIYASMDLEVPPKVLLVDDEKEFVLTLSERLQTRNLESAIAHDGEEALSIVEADAPDVMVLDLKMPGIDGLEVLRRVKRDRPHTEVIILTGHGSDKEERLARELGAFAYLRKPVDIDVLTETMKRAYAKVKARQAGEGSDTDG